MRKTKKISIMEKNSVQELLAFVPCLMAGPKAIYVSTPITNGERLLGWLRGVSPELKADVASYEAQLREQVIAPNCADGTQFANKVRNDTGREVIDPAPFMVPGWTQEEYLDLWEQVIVQYASEVRFNDGWAYSNGCAQEYLIATKAGVPRYDSSGQPLSVSQACSLLQKVIPALQYAGLSTGILEDVLLQLRNLTDT